MRIDTPPCDLIGLTLSGGGIRSASFSLGVLNAFCRTGLLKYVDYLSTVSGGGYAGTYLSTLLCADPPPDQANPSSAPARASSASSGAAAKASVAPPAGGGTVPECRIKEDLLLDKDGKPRVFNTGGRYLTDPIDISSRYLIGLVLNSLFFGSLLVFIACLLALIGRLPDWPALTDAVSLWTPAWFHEHLRDWSRPFVIPSLIFFAWGGVWITRYVIARRRGHENWVLDGGSLVLSSLTWAMIVSTLVGVVVLFSTAEIDLGGLLYPAKDKSQLASGVAEKQFLTSHTRAWTWLPWIVLGLFLSFVNPAQLMRSELRPPGKVRAMVLTLTGSILILLLPASIVFWFAREDCSGYVRGRLPDFSAADFHDPMAFISAVAGQHEPNGDNNPPGSEASPTLQSIIADALRKEFEDQAFAGLRKELERQICNGSLYAPGDSATSSQLSSGMGWDAFVAYLRERRGSHESNELSRPTLYWATEPRKHFSIGTILWPMRPVADREARTNFRQKLVLRDALQSFCAGALNKSYLTSANAIEHVHANTTLREIKKAPKTAQNFMPGAPSASTQASDAPAKTLSGFISPLSIAAQKRITRECELLEPIDPNMSSKEIKEFNRRLAEAAFPDSIAPLRSVRRMAVWGYDMQYRAIWLLATGVVFVVAGRYVNINATSLHQFYRHRLADEFDAKRAPLEGDLRDRTNHPLSEIRPTRYGGPYHLVVATLNDLRFQFWKMSEFRSAFSYTFSPDFCGCEQFGYYRTADFRSADMRNGNRSWMDPATAMAISGAAFTPALFKNVVFVIMLLMMNLRLGQWLPLPKRDGKASDRGNLPKDKISSGGDGSSPSMAHGATAQESCERGRTLDAEERKMLSTPAVSHFAILRNLFLSADRTRPSYRFISDGGHNDNLGVGALILRRCKLIIVCDATHDPGRKFEDFLKLYARLPLQIGVRLAGVDDDSTGDPKDIDLGPLRLTIPAADSSIDQGRTSKSLSRQHFILARIIYPDDGYFGPAGNTPAADREGLFVYVKPTLVGDEPVDLAQFYSDQNEFPHDPTTDQMFTERQVESYRNLGEHIGKQLCKLINKGLIANGNKNYPDDGHDGLQLPELHPMRPCDELMAALRAGFKQYAQTRTPRGAPIHENVPRER